MTSFHASFGSACPAGRSAFLALFLLFLNACASPNAEPFQEFSKATTGVGSATNKALKESIAQSRDGLIDSVQYLNSFQSLKLYFRSEPGSYTWGNQPNGSWKDVLPGLNDEKAPEISAVSDGKISGPHSSQWINYYYKPQRVSAQIEEFNQTLARYGNLLSSLAAKNYLTDAEFKKMAASLNASAMQIGSLSGISTPRETALFSPSAITLFELYLKNRQKQTLRQAIEANTAQIKEFSALGQQLTFLLSVPVQRSYQQSFDQLVQQFASAKSEGGRRKQVQSAVVLNDSMIERWHLFAQMDAIYRRLPEAHQELAKAAGGQGGFAAVSSLSQSAERLQKTYESLREANEKTARADAKKEAQD